MHYLKVLEEVKSYSSHFLTIQDFFNLNISLSIPRSLTLICSSSRSLYVLLALTTLFITHTIDYTFNWTLNLFLSFSLVQNVTSTQTRTSAKSISYKLSHTLLHHDPHCSLHQNLLTYTRLHSHPNPHTHSPAYPLLQPLTGTEAKKNCTYFKLSCSKLELFQLRVKKIYFSGNFK